MVHRTIGPGLADVGDEAAAVPVRAAQRVQQRAPIGDDDAAQPGAPVGLRRLRRQPLQIGRAGVAAQAAARQVEFPQADAGAIGSQRAARRQLLQLMLRADALGCCVEHRAGGIGQAAQRRLLAMIEAVGRTAKHAQRADLAAIGQPQRPAGIAAQAQAADDLRMAREARVEQRIGHLEQRVAAQRPRAERQLARHAGDAVQAVAGDEVLTLTAVEAEQRHLGAAGSGRRLGQRGELAVRRLAGTMQRRQQRPLLRLLLAEFRVAPHRLSP